MAERPHTDRARNTLQDTARDPCTAYGDGSCATIPKLVLELNALCKKATLDFALSIGELIAERLYCGDIARLRSHQRKPDTALRRIATHPALAMSASMLYSCVAIYELCDRLEIRSWKHVSTSHLRLVLPLAPGDQSRLLVAAEENRWPVRRLDQEVAGIRATGGPYPQRGGRKRSSRLQNAVRKLQRAIDELKHLLLSYNHLADASPETALAVADAVRSAVELSTMVNARAAANTLPMDEQVSVHAEPEATLAGSGALNRGGNPSRPKANLVRRQDDYVSPDPART